MGNTNRILKKDCPGEKWPDNLPYLRCTEALNCSAGVPEQDKHDFPRHYRQCHPGVVYDFDNLIQCTYKEQEDHINHQKALPGGRTRNYTMFRRTPVQSANPLPQPLVTPQSLASHQPLAATLPLPAALPLAASLPLDTTPPLFAAPAPETWSCTLCNVAVWGVWATIDHIAGHDYTEINHDAGRKMIHALMEEGEIVEEEDLVYEEDTGRTWLLVSRVE